MSHSGTDEFAWVAYNYGETPREVVEARFPEGGYPMTLNAEDYKVFAAAVNQGIDAHLEAITGLETKNITDALGMPKCQVEITDKESLWVLLRRLEESDSPAALNLRGSILTTLQVEEI